MSQLNRSLHFLPESSFFKPLYRRVVSRFVCRLCECFQLEVGTFISANYEDRWAKKHRKLARNEEKTLALQEQLEEASSAPTPGKGMTRLCSWLSFSGFEPLMFYLSSFFYSRGVNTNRSAGEVPFSPCGMLYTCSGFFGSSSDLGIVALLRR